MVPMNRLTISQNEVQNWILFSPSVPMHSILNVFSSCGLEWSTRVIDCKTQIEALAGKIWIKEQTRKEKKERKKGICLHEIQAQITFMSKNSRESCNVIGNFHLRLCVVCTKNIQKQIVCMHACSWNAIDTYFFSLSLVNSLSIVDFDFSDISFSPFVFFPYGISGEKNANLRKFGWRWWWRHDNKMFLNIIFLKKKRAKLNMINVQNEYGLLVLESG